MGMREIMSIATAVKLNSMDFPNVPKGKLQELLDNALKTAFIASGLARHCRLDPEEAFLAGLLHDMGTTVIYSLIPNNELNDKLLDDFIADRHAEIGAMIAKKWNYPETIQNLILYHHNCSYSGKIDHLIALIQLADNLLSVGSDRGADPIILSELKLEQRTIDEIYSKAIESFNHIKG
jgi:putative nucleotidyltransferase with HDIG domain